MRDLHWGELLRLLSSFVLQRRFLARTPRWPPERMRAWQLARIRKLVAHAYRNVPFYRDLYAAISFVPEDLKTWDDFERLPFVSKDDVIAAYPKRMIAAGHDLAHLIVSRSSGSSGKVLDVAYDSRAMVFYLLAGLRLYQMGFDYRPWHKQLYIYTSPYPVNSLLGMYPCHFISTLAPIDEIIQTMVRLRPDLLVCYPSHLKLIVQDMNSADRRRLHLRAVSVNSEMSTQTERDALAAALDCPVLDEYSSEELTRIAGQCREHAYHLFEDVNYVEVLDERDRPTVEAGAVVGTNLHNFAMPMIRYRQNDLARIEPSGCRCGWRFRELKDLQGRKNDSFVLPSGKVLSSGFLLDATYEFLLAYRTAVRDFCLVQQRPDLVVLQAVPGDGWDTAVQEAIRKRFSEFLGEGVTFTIETVRECIKTKTGKRNPIMNRIGLSEP